MSYEIEIIVRKKTKDGGNIEFSTNRKLETIHDIADDIDCKFTRDNLDNLDKV